jgi:hypothetical protein
MRSRIRRHLGSLFIVEAKGDRAEAAGVAKTVGDARWTRHPELSDHQYAVLLLHIAAEIEHALMVEYLYAAYSLGGPQVPVDHRGNVVQWQETILGIAKEEMGHLLTVQNLLRCLGGPLNLDREDYPWDSDFYPFPFRLEPLSRKSLAKYVCAEAPPPSVWTGDEANTIRALAQEGADGERINRVGDLYDHIRELFEDRKAVKDSDFRGSTFLYQANWDEWGRGYRAGNRGNASGGAMAGTPDLLLIPVTTRTDALAAIKAVATQGEANATADDAKPSHFARFLKIFRHFPAADKWRPARNVPLDPIVTMDLGGAGDTSGWEGTPITHRQTALWAHLFNIRYRALLTNLLHTFEYPSNLSETSQTTPRGLLLHATFGEMYNLRALSQILVEAPLADGDAIRMAGPSFQMPYTLRLPVDPVDRWRLHLELLRASESLADQLLQFERQKHQRYLQALEETDRQTGAMIREILSRLIPKAALEAVSLV